MTEPQLPGYEPFTIETANSETHITIRTRDDLIAGYHPLSPQGRSLNTARHELHN